MTDESSAVQYYSRHFFGLGLTLSARFNLPWIAAHIFRLVAFPLAIQRTADATFQRKILVLNVGKEEFFQDVEASFADDTEIELICWSSYALNCVADEILAPSLDHNDYITDDPRIEKSKRKYRNFLLEVWKHYQARSPVHAVIGANFGYRVLRELAVALETAGTPLIIIQKENLNASGPARRALWHRIYKENRGPFGGRKILVYNDIERDLQISSGIAEPHKIVVTGMPRLDGLHRWRSQHSGPSPRTGPPQILFFAFSETEKLLQASQIQSAISGKTWGSFWEQTHRSIIRLAEDNPDINVIVKTKGNSRQDNAIHQMLAGRSAPGNLDIISGGDARELIIESDVVIGFNTTGLLEAVAAGKPIIAPMFSEARDEALREFILDLESAADYAHSPQELIEKALSYARNSRDIPQQLPESSVQVLKKWLGNDDGLSGRRVHNCIREQIGLPVDGLQHHGDPAAGVSKT